MLSEKYIRKCIVALENIGIGLGHFQGGIEGREMLSALFWEPRTRHSRDPLAEPAKVLRICPWCFTLHITSIRTYRDGKRAISRICQRNSTGPAVSTRTYRVGTMRKCFHVRIGAREVGRISMFMSNLSISAPISNFLGILVQKILNIRQIFLAAAVLGRRFRRRNG